MRICFKLMPLFLLLIVGMTAGCSGDNGPAGLEPPDYDITGTWTLTETADETDCDEGVNEYVYDAIIVQDGNDLTVTIHGTPCSGKISGSRVWWSGNLPEAGGTTTIHGMDLTVAEGGEEMAGHFEWDWTDGEGACSGSSELAAEKTG